ncbi:MAG: hypothetical protein JF610_13515 [Acidobacteria bacterium]|nr:hypothetical protein [Acidobacteriota bacterium]
MVFTTFRSGEDTMHNVRHCGIAAVFAVAMSSFATAASAQAKPVNATAASDAGKSLTWGPAPDVFPAGAKMAVERGDPSKSGEFVVRLSFPAGYKIPPHWPLPEQDNEDGAGRHGVDRREDESLRDCAGGDGAEHSCGGSIRDDVRERGGRSEEGEVGKDAGITIRECQTRH